MAKERMLTALSYFLLLIALVVTALLITAPRPNEAGKKLNVVIISIDSLRADHMGLYGYVRDTTPAIDAYARSAVVFDQYFSTSVLTPVSEASVQTGAYPLRTGVINFASEWSPGVTTIADELHRRGWRTAAFGSSPEFNAKTLRPGFSKGFDVFSLYQPVSGPDSTLENPFTQSGLSNVWRASVLDTVDSASDKPLVARRAAVPVADAATWIAEGEPNAPFFLWLTVGSVHWPYGRYAPAHFSDPRYDGFLDAEQYAQDPASQGVSIFSGLYGRLYNGARYDQNQNIVSKDIWADFAHLTDSYDDGVYDTDAQLRPLLRLLSSPAYRANTIVVIQSEHGEDLGDHGYVAHYDILRSQTHVPLIIRAPGISAGRISSLASGVDVVPTVYDLLGIPHAVTDGISQYAVMTDKNAPAPRDKVFLTRTPLWERVLSEEIPWLAPFTELDNVHHYYDTAVRTNEWLLIHRRSRDILRTYSWYGHLTGKPVVLPEYELYRVPSDSLELHNVYEEQKSAIQELQADLSAWEKEMAGVAPRAQTESEVQPYF